MVRGLQEIMMNCLAVSTSKSSDIHTLAQTNVKPFEKSTYRATTGREYEIKNVF